jgi:hypothetical protein
LRDIHEPASFFWSSSAGWLLPVAIAMALLLIGWWRRARQAADPRRAALRELAELRRRSTQGEADATLVAELATLLRRVALMHFPRTDVAGLCGRRWLEFLDREFVPQAFVGGIGECLAWAPYARAPDVDVTALVALAESALASSVEPGSHRRVVDSGVPGFDNPGGRALQRWRLVRAGWRVRSACIANDAVGARTAWLHWAQLMWPGSPPRGLQALGARFDDRVMHSGFAELDRCLYADGRQTWQGHQLWKRACVAFRRMPRMSRRDALPELYG